MAAHEQHPRVCDGCLDTEQCWICTGEGCHRCAASGRCHLCAGPVRVLELIPVQAVPAQDQVATAS